MTTVRLNIKIEVLAKITRSGNVISVEAPRDTALAESVCSQHSADELAELYQQATRPRMSEGLVRVVSGLRGEAIEYHRLVRTTPTQVVLRSPYGREERWSRKHGRQVGRVRDWRAPWIHRDDLAELNKRGQP